MLGVPVRRVEAAAWLGSGMVCGISGVLLGDLVGLDIVSVTFLVIPALAAALIGQLQSLWVTLIAGFVIGIVQSCLTAFYDVRSATSRSPSSARSRRSCWRSSPCCGSPASARSCEMTCAGARVTTDVGRSGRRPPTEALPAARPGSTAWHPAPARHRRRCWCSSSSCCRCSLDSYWLLVMTGVGDLQHRHARSRPPHRPGRDGLVVPVRPRRRRGLGGLRLSYGTSIPFPLLLLIAGLVTGCSACSSACRRCASPACTWR